MVVLQQSATAGKRLHECSENWSALGVSHRAQQSVLPRLLHLCCCRPGPRVLPHSPAEQLWSERAGLHTGPLFWRREPQHPRLSQPTEPGTPPFDSMCCWWPPSSHSLSSTSFITSPLRRGVSTLKFLIRFRQVSLGCVSLTRLDYFLPHPFSAAAICFCFSLLLAHARRPQPLLLGRANPLGGRPSAESSLSVTG